MTTPAPVAEEFFTDKAGRQHPLLTPRRSWLADVEMSTVIVLTTSDVSFKGLRAAVHDDCLVLAEAMLMGEEANTVLNGYVVIPRERVLAVQVVAP